MFLVECELGYFSIESFFHERVISDLKLHNNNNNNNNND